jgi:hypothetical protein
MKWHEGSPLDRGTREVTELNEWTVSVLSLSDTSSRRVSGNAGTRGGGGRSGRRVSNNSGDFIGPWRVFALIQVASRFSSS